MKAIALIAGALTLLSGQALAQDDDRSATIDIQFGQYRPDIDSGFDAASDPGRPLPYAASFSNQRTTMIMVGWEKILTNVLGSMSVGFGVGYWSVDGQAVSPTGTDISAEDTTSFVILPLQAQLTYRFDVWAESLALVPVVRAGVDYYAWEIYDGSGDTAYFDLDGTKTNEASGGTYGYHTTFGVHLLLDALSPGMAGNFERNAGVFNSYLTFEYRLSSIDDFAAADSFRLGDETFVVGLALDL